MHTTKAITMHEAVSLQQWIRTQRASRHAAMHCHRAVPLEKGLEDVNRRDEHEYTQEL
jgi:hypothetical protein